LTANAALQMLEKQATQGEAILEHSLLAATDPEKATSLWASIVENWTLQGQVAALKPLTPEQLAASAMRATGFLAQAEAVAKAAIEKSPPAEIEDACMSELEKKQITAIAIQVDLLNRLRSSVNQFVDQFGGLVGEEFQATVNQALFLGNSPTVSNWLVDNGGTLVERLTGISQPQELANELSLALLARPAELDEQQQIAKFLFSPAGEVPVERSIAISELVWAMLTSNEFRFNH